MPKCARLSLFARITWHGSSSSKFRHWNTIGFVAVCEEQQSVVLSPDVDILQNFKEIVELSGFSKVSVKVCVEGGEVGILFRECFILVFAIGVVNEGAECRLEQSAQEESLKSQTCHTIIK